MCAEIQIMISTAWNEALRHMNVTPTSLTYLSKVYVFILH